MCANMSRDGLSGGGTCPFLGLVVGGRSKLMHCVGDAEERKEEHEQFLAHINPFQDIDIDTYLRFM